MSVTTLRRTAMCRPTYFKVLYEINPWMDKKSTVNNSRAQEQWLTLKRALEAHAVKVDVIEPNSSLPDMVFASNAGLAWKNKVYLSRFRHSQRQPERAEFEQWFQAQGFQIFKDEKFYFEGGGDARFSSPKKLWGGYGFRSDEGVYDLIKEMGDFDVVKCHLRDNRFYHLDLCFLPLDDRTALWFPRAFTDESRKRMENEINLIAVDEWDAVKFVCNSIIVGTTVIMPPGCRNIQLLLENKGYRVIECGMSEFTKGGCACQSLVFRRDFAELADSGEK